ncbi:MAG: glycosyltransferase family 39 protein [Thermodesulfovibrionales bacterium]
MGQIKSYFLLILVAFLLCESYLFYYHSMPLTLGESDGIEYMQGATGPLLKIDDFHGPGYPWAIRLVHWTGLGLFSAAKVVSIVFGVLFLVATWLLLSSVAGTPNAIMSTLLILANSIFLFSGTLILSDIMAASLMLMGLAVILAFSDADRKVFIFSGALCGLAYLTRYIYIIALAAPLLWLLLSPRGPGRIQRAVLFFTGFSLVTAPWMVFLYSEKGSPFWNINYLNVAYAMYSKTRLTAGGDAGVFRTQFNGLIDVISSDPGLFVNNCLRNFLYLPWSALKMFSLAGLFGAAGWLFWFKDLNWKKKFLGLIMLLYCLVLCTTWLENRLLLLMLPLTASFISAGILALPGNVVLPLVKLFTMKSLRVAVSHFVAVIAVTALSISAAVNVQSFFDDEAPEYVVAAEWLSTRAKYSNLSILAAKPHIAFLSNSQNRDFRDCMLQYVGEADLPQMLKAVKPDYFVYDERYAFRVFPQFGRLLYPENNPYPGILKPVLTIYSPKKIVIYKYLGQTVP